jgi:hypothetical protein
VCAGGDRIERCALLFVQDRRVLDRDKNIAVGGCSSSFEREGYTFDVAASGELSAEDAQNWSRYGSYCHDLYDGGADDDPDAERVRAGHRAYLRVCLMMLGMTIDVVENSAWPLRTAALKALVFDVFYVVHRLLQGLGPMTLHLRGSQHSTLAHRSALQASEVAVGLALLAALVSSPPAHP